MPDAAAVELWEAEARGKALVKSFVEDRLVNKNKSVYDPIKRCSLAIFSGQKKRTLLAPILKTLKSDLQLYSRLFIVSTARNLDLDKFFEYENQSSPPSISINGVIRSGVKSHLVEMLEMLVRPLNTPPPIASDAIVFDGAVLAHAVQPLPTMKNFKEYASSLASHVTTAGNKLGVKRIDVVWDMYSTSSLKGFTRAGRGADIRRQDLPTKGK